MDAGMDGRRVLPRPVLRRGQLRWGKWPAIPADGICFRGELRAGFRPQAVPPASMAPVEPICGALMPPDPPRQEHVREVGQGSPGKAEHRQEGWFGEGPGGGKNETPQGEPIA